MKYVQMGVLGSILAVQSYHDIRKKEIPFWITAIGGVFGILFWIIEGSFSMEWFLGLVPGLLCLGYAKISREAIGYGDGLLICMMGIYLKMSSLLSLCMWAFIMAGVVALFLLVTGEKKGNQEIAFVPFLFLAFLMGVFIGDMA